MRPELDWSAHPALLQPGVHEALYAAGIDGHLHGASEQAEPDRDATPECECDADCRCLARA